LGLARAARAQAGGRTSGIEILAVGYGGLHSSFMRHRHERMPKLNASRQRTIFMSGFSLKAAFTRGIRLHLAASRYWPFLAVRPDEMVISAKRCCLVVFAFEPDAGGW